MCSGDISTLVAVSGGGELDSGFIESGHDVTCFNNYILR